MLSRKYNCSEIVDDISDILSLKYWKSASLYTCTAVTLHLIGVMFGRLKTQDMKMTDQLAGREMQDRKLKEQIAGRENARHENEGQ